MVFTGSRGRHPGRMHEETRLMAGCKAPRAPVRLRQPGPQAPPLLGTSLLAPISPVREERTQGGCPPEHEKRVNAKQESRRELSYFKSLCKASEHLLPAA